MIQGGRRGQVTAWRGGQRSSTENRLQRRGGFGVNRL